MPEIQEVIDQSNAATEYVAASRNPLDNSTAELVLSNTAVLADRLTPEQFSELEMPAVDAMLDAAASAKEIAPLAEVDQQKSPRETRQEHEYRTEVRAPLYKLQSMVRYGEFDGANPNTVSDVKRAVWLGNKAFQKVVTDPAVIDSPGVQQTVDFFGTKAKDAAGRAKKLEARNY